MKIKEIKRYCPKFEG